jgi:hypothetical protein
MCGKQETIVCRTIIEGVKVLCLTICFRDYCHVPAGVQSSIPFCYAMLDKREITEMLCQLRTV